MSKIALEPNASGTGTFTIASPNSDTSRTLTLPDADGALLNDASSLDASNLTGALPAIDGSALTGISSGGMTLLGTLPTTSGTSVTLSDLSLTDYKALRIVVNGFLGSNSYDVLRMSTTYGLQFVTPGQGTSGLIAYTFIDVDLGTGVTEVSPTGYVDSTTFGYVTVSASYRKLLQSGFSTSTTSITFSASTALTAGSIDIYGVA